MRPSRSVRLAGVLVWTLSVPGAARASSPAGDVPGRVASAPAEASPSATGGNGSPAATRCPEPPASLAATPGAPLDLAGYGWSRAIELGAGAGVYSLLLEPEDLARAQPGLADVRIVDGSGRQVPYVLERDAAERWFPLEPSPAGGAPARRDVSRTRLVLQGLAPELRVPVSGLSVDFAEPAFSRPLLVTAPDPRGEGRRVVHGGTVSRMAGNAAPVVISVDPVRARELTLEIEDGDNAPLGLTAARALVLVPRVVFAWNGDPAGPRLVYGARHARPPRYDLAGLRADVLACAARPARLGPVAAVAAREGAGDLRGERTVLWIALVVLVAGLLLTAVRLVQKVSAVPRR